MQALLCHISARLVRTAWDEPCLVFGTSYCDTGVRNNHDRDDLPLAKFRLSNVRGMRLREANDFPRQEPYHALIPTERLFPA